MHQFQLKSPSLGLDRHIPARYVVTQREVYIVYYQTDPSTGIRNRFRNSHDLNRIKDIVKRDIRAQLIVQEINDMLPSGWPYTNQPVTHTIEDALIFGMDIKRKKIPDDKSYNAYTVQYAGLIDYINFSGLSGKGIEEFTREHAFKYIDYVQEKKALSNRTINNYVIILKALFYTILERGMITVNPFAKYPKLDIEQGYRREFNDYERRIVAGYIKEHDKLLFLAIILEYYCFLRPKDIRNITFGQFNLKKQLIMTPSGTSKNKKTQHVTIPKILVDTLMEMPEFERFPLHWYVFGAGGVPGSVKIGANTLNYRHQKILEQLMKENLLMDISGLTLYSWKYSGNQALFDMNVNLMEIKRQNRHHSITVTQIYAERHDPENPTIKNLTHDITD